MSYGVQKSFADSALSGFIYTKHLTDQTIVQTKRSEWSAADETLDEGSRGLQKGEKEKLIIWNPSVSVYTYISNLLTLG